MVQADEKFTSSEKQVVATLTAAIITAFPNLIDKGNGKAAGAIELYFECLEAYEKRNNA